MSKIQMSNKMSQRRLSRIARRTILGIVMLKRNPSLPLTNSKLITTMTRLDCTCCRPRKIRVSVCRPGTRMWARSIPTSKPMLLSLARFTLWEKLKQTRNFPLITTQMTPSPKSKLKYKWGYLLLMKLRRSSVELNNRESLAITKYLKPSRKDIVNCYQLKKVFIWISLSKFKPREWSITDGTRHWSLTFKNTQVCVMISTRNARNHPLRHIMISWTSIWT